MLHSAAPIGVLDAGFGGYTVVKELQRILPEENIIFFGDGKNQPYGNRSREEILFLVRQCLAFFEQKGVKFVAVGCNTISTLIDEYKDEFPFPISSIVRAGSDALVSLRPPKAILLSTVFTAKSGCYERYVLSDCPEMQIIPCGSKWLARLIEDGDFDREKIKKELHDSLDEAVSQHPDADTVIQGCTHFPLVADMIRELFPQFTNLINPAAVQAQQVKTWLEHSGLLNRNGGNLNIYTTSDCQVYTRLAQLVGLRMTAPVELAPAPKTLTETIS